MDKVVLSGASFAAGGAYLLEAGHVAAGVVFVVLAILFTVVSVER